MSGAPDLYDTTAVIVTRGDVPLDPIIAGLPFERLVVWDNAVREDLAVYGRYAAIADTPTPYVFVQDDDCRLPSDSIMALLAAYKPGHITCNMPAEFRAHYTDSGLVGFGAVFDRDLPQQAFKRAGGDIVQAAEFLDTCDVVFTTLTPMVWVDVPYENLPYATGPDRMYRQPNHVGERQRMLELARKVRDA